MKTHWIACLLILCLPFHLRGQVRITGTVSGEGEPVPARVSVHLIDPAGLYTGTYADSLGNFILPPVYYNDSLRIEVAALGFYPAEQIIDAGARDGFYLTFELVAAPLDLPTSTVAAQRIGIRVRGDTIHFDPLAYLRGNERTLGDLIERIPELTLTENGEVEYRGDPIDVLLVDGMDLLNGQQRSATESLGIGHVLDLQIIENYRGPGDFMTGMTENVALNVVLSDSSKGKWLGRQLLATGSDWRSTGEADLTRTAKNYGTHLALAARNDGTIALSARDYLNAVGDLGRAFEDTPSGQFSLENLIPEELQLPAGLNQQRDVLANLGFQRNGDRRRLRGGLLALHLDRSTRKNTDQRIAGAPGERLLGTERSGNRSDFQLLSLGFEPARDREDSLSRWGADLIGERTAGTQELTFSVGEEGEENSRRSQRKLSLEPRVYWYGPSDGLVTLVGQLTYKYTSQRSDYYLQANPSLRLDSSTVFTQYNQQLSTESNEAEAWLRGRVRVGKYEIRSKILLSGENYAARDQVNFDENRLLNVNLRGRTGRLTGSVERSFGKLSVLLRADRSLVHRSRHSETISKPGYRYGAYLRWPASGINQSLLSWVSTSAPATDLAAASDRFYLVGPRSFARQNATLLSLARTHRLSYSGQRSGMLGPKSTVRVSAAGSSGRNQVVRAFLRSGDFFVEQWRSLEESVSARGEINLRYALGKAITLQHGAATSRTWQTGELGGGNSLPTLSHYSFSTDLRSDPGTRLEGRVGVAWERESQRLAENNLDFTTLRYTTSLRYTYGRWRGDLAYAVARSSAETLTVNNQSLDARIDFSPGNEKWSFFLRGVNLLQLRPRPVQSVRQSTNGTTFFRYDTFPGFIQVGVEYLR